MFRFGLVIGMIVLVWGGCSESEHRPQTVPVAGLPEATAPMAPDPPTVAALSVAPEAMGEHSWTHTFRLFNFRYEDSVTGEFRGSSDQWWKAISTASGLTHKAAVAAVGLTDIRVSRPGGTKTSPWVLALTVNKAGTGETGRLHYKAQTVEGGAYTAEIYEWGGPPDPGDLSAHTTCSAGTYRGPDGTHGQCWTCEQLKTWAGTSRSRIGQITWGGGCEKPKPAVPPYIRVSTSPGRAAITEPARWRAQCESPSGERQWFNMEQDLSGAYACPNQPWIKNNARVTCTHGGISFLQNVGVNQVMPSTCSMFNSSWTTDVHSAEVQCLIRDSNDISYWWDDPATPENENGWFSLPVEEGNVVNMRCPDAGAKWTLVTTEKVPAVVQESRPAKVHLTSYRAPVRISYAIPAARNISRDLDTGDTDTIVVRYRGPHVHPELAADGIHSFGIEVADRPVVDSEQIHCQREDGRAKWFAPRGQTTLVMQPIDERYVVLPANAYRWAGPRKIDLCSIIRR